MKRVAVAIINKIDSDGTSRFLLVKSRRDFGEFTGCWYPPGGHVEEREDEQDALRRELAEELGLAIRPVRKIAETPGDVPGQLTSWWRAEAPVSDLNVDEVELAGAGWFTREEMSAMRLWPATRAFFGEFFTDTN